MIIQAIEQFAITQPNQIALRNKDFKISYANLIEQMNTIKTYISQRNPKVIGLALDNSLAWAVIDLAAMALNITIVPIPLFFTVAQRKHTLQDAGITHIFCDTLNQFEWLINLEEESVNLNNLEIAHQKIFSFETKPLNTPTLPANTIKITYTSGSTAEAKGVCLNLTTIEQVAASLKVATQANANDHHLCMIPLSTLLENLAGIYVPLLAGATVSILPLAQVGIQGSSGFDAKIFMQAILQQQATSIILTPELLLALVSCIEAGFPTPSQLRFIAVGGASVSPKLLEKAEKFNLPVFEGYGLSECGSVVSLNMESNIRMGSVGKPLPHIQISFSDTGEILVKGAQMLGYLNDTSDHRDVAQQGNDFVKTGDLGFLDDDGYLFVTGRIKNLFITSFGRNIAPEWVERELNLMPSIAQSALFGEAMPFNTAIIVANPNATLDTIEADIAKVNLTLPDYAKVGKWIRADEPFSLNNAQLTANHRIRRSQIWDQYGKQIEELMQRKEYQYGVL